MVIGSIGHLGQVVAAWSPTIELNGQVHTYSDSCEVLCRCCLCVPIPCPARGLDMDVDVDMDMDVDTDMVGIGCICEYFFILS